MYSKRLLSQLFVALAVLSVSEGTWLNTRKLEGKAIAARQLSIIGDILGGTSSSDSGPKSTTSEKTEKQSTSAVPPTSSTPAPASVPAPTTTSSPADPTTSVAPATSNPSPPTSSTPVIYTPTSPVAQPTSSAAAQNTNFTPQQTPTTTTSSRQTSVTLVVSTKVEVYTATRSDGSKETLTSLTKTTSTAVLSPDDGETSGMATKTRNTVIGVVVGVGGAIVLATLGLVAWRIWGRKKHNEEHHGLMDYDLSAPGVEKSERGSSAGGAQPSPFRSTLENYHQPGQMNASANF
ncbi:uncharacterized protein UV8b_02339 [Ustilaginoidea virens]|uniref:Mid2 domain-containing protein n=1 Tax=Ustilaginoidea virens TaxID=1159556 RepID=A0A063BYF0_USTVR|nr:uncharacterized protein UV8b_02339 [Ustilaginoidea virens]QUC18098.1 hypothetical protein UV8b_02339 [Ustilaginoidea virens]GAO15053.1 hypothetical protein UVI_02048840 [Ustilaginoidea virens]